MATMMDILKIASQHGSFGYSRLPSSGGRAFQNGGVSTTPQPEQDSHRMLVLGEPRGSLNPSMVATPNPGMVATKSCPKVIQKNNECCWKVTPRHKHRNGHESGPHESCEFVNWCILIAGVVREPLGGSEVQLRTA